MRAKKLIETLRAMAGDWADHPELGSVRVISGRNAKDGNVWVRTKQGLERLVSSRDLQRRPQSGLGVPRRPRLEGAYDNLLRPAVPRVNIFADVNPADAAATLQSSIKAELVNVRVSTLGGPGRESLMITVSLDPRESWPNGILENSRYFKARLGSDGILEVFSGNKVPKFRKSRVRGVEQAAAKLNAFIAAEARAKEYLDQQPA